MLVSSLKFTPFQPSREVPQVPKSKALDSLCTLPSIPLAHRELDSGTPFVLFAEVVHSGNRHPFRRKCGEFLSIQRPPTMQDPVDNTVYSAASAHALEQAISQPPSFPPDALAPTVAVNASRWIVP